VYPGRDAGGRPPQFSDCPLRAENAGAARLYESLGFQPCVDQNVTHILHFEPLVTK
jgi:hypothetical protein